MTPATAVRKSGAYSDPGDGRYAQNAASGATANGFGASADVPVNADVTLIVGLTAMRADNPIANDKASSEGMRRLPVGSRPLGKTMVIPKSATNTSVQPHALHQASRFSNGLNLSVPSHSTGAVTWMLAIIRPQPIAISSQPTLFLGSRLTSNAPIPAKAVKNIVPAKSVSVTPMTRPATVDRIRTTWSGTEARAGAPVVVIPLTTSL